MLFYCECLVEGMPCNLRQMRQSASAAAKNMQGQGLACLPQHIYFLPKLGYQGRHKAQHGRPRNLCCVHNIFYGCRRHAIGQVFIG